MISHKRDRQIFCLLFTCLIALIGCGKKETTSSNGQPDSGTYSPIPLEADLKDLLDKQVVACGAEGCPDYITKIAVVDRGEVRFCTGFLTDTGTVATSSSCLPDLMRLQGQNCENEIFFFFPGTNSKPSVRAGCRRVLQVSRVDDFSNPYLWRENIAFLELDKNVFRRSLKISKEGMSDKKKLDIWKIDQLDKYNSIVRREECVVVHNTYLNPLGSHKFSPSMLVGNCSFVKGNSGAPLIDSQGKLRAVASADINREMIKSLADQGYLDGTTISSMMHTNNMACAPNIDDNEGYPDRECIKELSMSYAIRLRAEMIDENLLFSEFVKETAAAITENNKYVNFEARLVENDNGKFNVKFFPRCFINADQWRNKPPKSKTFYVTTPYYELARGMDSYTRLKVNKINSSNTQFRIDFNPREVISGNSPVSIKSSVFSSSFSNIPSNCVYYQ